MDIILIIGSKVVVLEGENLTYIMLGIICMYMTAFVFRGIISAILPIQDIFDILPLVLFIFVGILTGVVSFLFILAAGINVTTPVSFVVIVVGYVIAWILAGFHIRKMEEIIDKGLS